MDTNQIKAQIIKTLEDSITEIKEEQARNRRALIGDNTVICVSEGLYLRQEGKIFTPTSISRCTRYPVERAVQLTNTLPQSPDWMPVATNLHEALNRELHSLMTVLNLVQTNNVATA